MFELSTFYLLKVNVLRKTVDMNDFLLSSFFDSFHVMKYFMAFFLVSGGDGFHMICGTG